MSDSVVRLLSGLLGSAEFANNTGTTAETVSTKFLKRLAPLPVMQFLTSSLLEKPSESAKEQAGTDWLNDADITAECRCAVFGLAAYLHTLNLSRSLCDPAVEVLNRSDDCIGDTQKGSSVVTSSSESKLKEPADSRPDSFKLDAVTARDLEVFQCALGPSMTESNAHGGALERKVQQKEKKAGQNDALQPMSLFDVINFCKSTYGRRTLRHWLLHPLCQLSYDFVNRTMAIHGRADRPLFVAWDGQGSVADYQMHKAVFSGGAETKHTGGGASSKYVDMFIAMQAEFFLLNPLSTFSFQILAVRLLLGMPITTNVPRMRKRDVYMRWLTDEKLLPWVSINSLEKAYQELKALLPPTTPTEA